jgi:glycerol-3-phosphate O-acyltransferase/dihydroxyacetone phosphate acyltransferase
MSGVAEIEKGTSRKDRFLEKLFSFLTRSLYREVDVYSPVPIPSGSPQLNVANHFGGVSDALILSGVLPDRPGIVARDVIWNVPLVGRLMNWIGAIPVHKPEDHTSPTSNDEMFASCYTALEDSGNILIFPEGVTRNEPSIARVKTGAARIAIGARAQGVEGIRIVPLGIHYEDKAALRSRVFINVGVPIDLDRVIAEGALPTDVVTAADRAAVDNLTDEIEVALRRAAPDFRDWSEAGLLAKGAEVALRSQLDDPSGEVPFGLRNRLANTLADLPEDHRSRICSAVAEYRGDLEAIGATDAVLHSRLRTGGFLRTLIWQIIIGIFLVPFVAVGVAINVIPFLLVKAVGLMRVAPSMHSTIKPVVATLAFGVAWGLVIWRVTTTFGGLAGVAAFILLPVYLAAVVLFIERGTLMLRAYRRWRAPAEPQAFSEQILARRTAVVEAVLRT